MQSSVRAEADMTWDEVYRCVKEMETKSSVLRKAQDTHANAKRILIDFEAALRSMFDVARSFSVHLLTSIHALPTSAQAGLAARAASSMCRAPHLGYDETEQPAGAVVSL